MSSLLEGQDAPFYFGSKIATKTAGAQSEMLSA
jgi:hypothetical protein